MRVWLLTERRFQGEGFHLQAKDVRFVAALNPHLGYNRVSEHVKLIYWSQLCDIRKILKRASASKRKSPAHEPRVLHTKGGFIIGHDPFLYLREVTAKGVESGRGYDLLTLVEENGEERTLKEVI